METSFVSIHRPSSSSYPNHPFLPSPTITKNYQTTFIVSSTRSIHATNTAQTTLNIAPSSWPKRLVPKNSPEANQSLLAKLFKAFDTHINNFLDQPLRLSVNPAYVFSDNFAPVNELPPTECEIINGTLPPCLDGAYIRNGPNPQFLTRGAYHYFDGDGMLHCIRISQGRAILCSRYVETNKYTVEREAGIPIVPNIFGGFHGLGPTFARATLFLARVLAGHYNPINGIGVANTSLAFFGGKLYALCESDVPYAVKLELDGDIVTLGRQNFDNGLCVNMTAHPKIDPETKEAFAFRYWHKRPFLTFFRFDKYGNIQPDVPIISVTRPCIIHDFAITKQYAIFCEMQVGVQPLDMVKGGSLVGVDPAKVSRLGLIPRYSKDDKEMRWFDVPGFNILHAVNAWDDHDNGGDTVVLVAPNLLPVEHVFERMDLMHISMEKVTIDLKAGTVSRQSLSTRSLDMAVINQDYVGRKSRYVYAAVGDPMPMTSRIPRISGIVKLDVAASEGDQRECIVASHMYRHGCYGSEPFFVAKEPDNPNAEEDEGYIMCFVHDEHTGESKFLVMDAKSPRLEIVAEVKLPQRVPYGLHGLFIKEDDLNKL